MNKIWQHDEGRMGGGCVTSNSTRLVIERDRP